MKLELYSQKWESSVVDLWNRTCTFDPIDVERFRRQALFDDNFDRNLSFAAVEEGRLIGFAFATKRKFPYLERGLEPERGWINVLFVDRAYWGRGTGAELLKACESALQERGCKTITLGAYSPSYFFWGVDTVHYPEAARFFEEHDYAAKDTHYSMGRDLHGFVIPEEVQNRIEAAEEKGYRIVPFDYSYSLELLEFLRDEFGGGWKKSALEAMRSNTAQDRILLVLDENGKICGFSNRAIDGNPMRFGPIGISKEKRSEGLGTLLLNRACFEMARKGIYHMFFMTTDEAGRRYYERSGITVIREFTVYDKAL